MRLLNLKAPLNTFPSTFLPFTSGGDESLGVKRVFNIKVASTSKFKQTT